MLLQFIERLKLSAEQSTQFSYPLILSKGFPQKLYHFLPLCCTFLMCCLLLPYMCLCHLSSCVCAHSHECPFTFLWGSAWHHSNGPLFSCPDYSTVLLCIRPTSSAVRGCRFPPLTDSCLVSLHNRFESLWVLLLFVCLVISFLYSVGAVLSKLVSWKICVPLFVFREGDCYFSIEMAW